MMSLSFPDAPYDSTSLPLNGDKAAAHAVQPNANGNTNELAKTNGHNLTTSSQPVHSTSSGASLSTPSQLTVLSSFDHETKVGSYDVSTATQQGEADMLTLTPEQQFQQQQLLLQQQMSALGISSSPFPSVTPGALYNSPFNAYADTPYPTSPLELQPGQHEYKQQYEGRNNYQQPVNYTYQQQTQQLHPNSNLGIQEQYNTILAVQVYNALMPTDINTLYSVFAQYGEINRIIMFQKGSIPCAWIEFANLQSALLALTNLNNCNMYSTCNTLKINFSNLKAPLVITPNNPMMRDFTSLKNNAHAQQRMAELYQQQFAQQLQQQQQQYLTNQQLYSQQFTPQQLAAYNQMYGAASPYNMVSYSTPDVVAMTGSSFPPAHPGYYTRGGANRPALNEHLIQQQFTGGVGSVLTVDNLDTQHVTTDILFTLFGVYGDVIRVKLLFHHKPTALIQFMTVFQAQQALNYLQSQLLFGKPLVISVSKFDNIRLPTPSQVISQNQQMQQQQQQSGVIQYTTAFTRDYAHHQGHRFKYVSCKNSKHVCAPSAALHVSGMSDDVNETDLFELFAHQLPLGNAGNPSLPLVQSVSMFGREKRMAFVVLRDIPTAIMGLIYGHNVKLKSKYIRITFSHAKEHQHLSQQHSPYNATPSQSQITTRPSSPPSEFDSSFSHSHHHEHSLHRASLSSSTNTQSANASSNSTPKVEAFEEQSNTSLSKVEI